jgi:hypothetical protein
MPDSNDPAVLDRAPDAGRAPTLEYRTAEEQEDTFRDKAWWVAAAAGVMAGLALVGQVLNFVLYFFPRSFTGVSSGLIQNGSTNWGMMAATLVMTGVSLGMFVAAVMYLRGRDTRRALVRLAALEILCSAALMSFGQYTYFRGRAMPELAIDLVWLLTTMTQHALVPALVIVFFHRRATRRSE